MYIFNDHPITNKRQDQYGRLLMAQHCASVINEVSNEDGFVIGLSGPWGSGKTSLIELIIEELKSSNPSVARMRFNPWLYSTEEQLLSQFFAELKKEVGGTQNEKLGKALTQYADAVSSSIMSLAGPSISSLATLNHDHAFFGVLGSFMFSLLLKKAGKAIGSSGKTLEELREELERELRKREDNVLIIIDDIDRLPREEICLIFKLVNLTAAFPRLTYLLAYDSEVVEKALGEIQGISGHDYLDKIVQLPLEIPALSEDVIQRNLSDALDPCLGSYTTYQNDPGEDLRLIRTFNFFVAPRTDTPRKIKRYVNKVVEFLDRVGEDICPTDALAFVGIALFFPHLYHWIWNNQHALCFGAVHLPSLNKEDSNAYGASLEEAFALDYVRPEELASAKEAFSQLFPRSSRWGDPGIFHANSSVGRETGRIAHVSNLGKCFAAYDGITTERLQLHVLTYDSDAESFRKVALQLDAHDEFKRLLEFIDEARTWIDCERKEFLAEQLIHLSASIAHDRPNGLLIPSVPDTLARTTELLFRDLGKDIANQIVLSAVDTFDHFDYCYFTWFIRDERLSQQGEGGAPPCLSAEVYQQLAANYLEAVTTNWHEVLCLPNNQIQFFWRALDADFDSHKLSKVRAKYGKDTKVRILCAAHLLNEWHSSDGLQFASPYMENKGYQPVLEAPSLEDIEVFVAGGALAELQLLTRVRVAALYLLLRNSREGDLVSADQRIPLTEAEEQEKSWRVCRVTQLRARR